MILEINRDEVYEGCPMVEEIDDYVAKAGFHRALTFWQSESSLSIFSKLCDFIALVVFATGC